MPNPLAVEIFGCTLTSPTVLASGILGTTRGILERVALEGAGAATIKSVSREVRKGHPNPTVIAFGAGTINAIGYSNPGIAKAACEFRDLGSVGCPVIGSIIGTHPDDFAAVASEFDKLDFAALEVPLSCPHTPGFGRMSKQDNPDTVFAVVSAICKTTSKPLLVKLPPAAGSLIEMAQAAKEAGAYGITAVNTIGPAMVIDIDCARPVLGFGIGGISGPALKPLAIAAVYELYAKVDMPIIGTGGVSSGRDAVEMLMAGATAVGVGTAVIEQGVSVFAKINREIAGFLSERGMDSVQNLRGLAHHDGPAKDYAGCTSDGRKRL